MQDTPSRTALRVALRRAAHQLYDAPPLVFEDPLAVRILGSHAAELTRTPGLNLGRRPSQRDRTHSSGLRAFLVARSRYTEDTLAQAVAHGTRQYVLLGAGLDTFAHRNPHPGLRVFELDHPATQAWKRDLLAQADLPHPPRLHYAPIDFQTQTLAEALRAAGFDPTQPTLFAALGVVPYLTPDAFRATLAFVAGQPPGSALLFDYAQPAVSLPAPDRLALESLSARVEAAGEPFRLFFTPPQLHTELATHHLHVADDLDFDALNTRYFTDRPDTLRLISQAGRLLHAETFAATR